MKYDVIRSYWPAPIYSDGSTLDLDFLTGTLDSRLTFTRASTATYINSSGYVTTMGAAPTNDPTKARFDYDPVTLAPRGLLIEGTAINLLKNSAYADTNWIAFGGYTKSITTGITSPANDTTAARLTFTAVGHGLYTNNTQMAYTNTVGATYTMSAWIRATSNTTNLNIRFGDSAVATGPNIPITTTWTRYSYSYVAASASGPLVQSASGSHTGEFEMWGFQLEAGSGASSYIPTVASQVTRNKDSMTLSDLSALGITNTAGTLVADFTNSTENSNYAGSLSFRSAAGSTYAARFRWATTAILTTYFQSNGSTGFTTNLNGSRTSFARCKAATSYSYDGTTTSVFGSMNGAAMSATSTTTQAASIAIPTSLRWNDDGSTPSATDYPSMVMRSVKYYPTCLTIAQMNTLTTL
jgi:hypothetical protein